MASRLFDLSNDALRTALNNLSISDRLVQVELLLHLVELDRRRVFLLWGYVSLWDFARRELKWSEGTAVRRVAVARLVGKVDAVVPYLRDGRVSLCMMAILAPLITTANAVEVLNRAQGLARREVEALAVELGAKPAVPRKDVIRLLGALAPTGTPPTAVEPAPPTAATSESVPQPVVPALAASQPTPSSAKPIAPAAPVRLHRVAFDANDDFVANIARLREVLGNAALNELMLRASEALLDRVDPIRRHIRRENRKAKKAKQSLKQTITSARSELKILKHRQPAAVRDEVANRDGGQCSFVSKDGVRCAARSYLHIDHIRPFAMGGSSTDVENNRVLCAAHNLARAGAARASEF